MPIDIEVGQVFGRYTVLTDLGSNGKNHYYGVRCSCGQVREVRSYCLTSGESQSCGCLAVELSTTHGDAHSPTYESWAHMKRRVLNPLDAAYSYYGGRGITLDKRWLDYSNFLADMGKCPPGLTLERIDNDGPYSPENCKWASRKDQSNNRRSNVLLEFGGLRLNIAQWAKRTGIKKGTLHYRIKNGWSVEDALQTPTLSLTECGILGAQARWEGGQICP